MDKLTLKTVLNFLQSILRHDVLQTCAEKSNTVFRVYLRTRMPHRPGLSSFCTLLSLFPFLRIGTFCRSPWFVRVWVAVRRSVRVGVCVLCFARVLQCVCVVVSGYVLPGVGRVCAPV